MRNFPEKLHVMWNSSTGLLEVKEPGTSNIFPIIPSKTMPGCFEILQKMPEPGKRGARTDEPKEKETLNLEVIEGGKDD